MSFWKYTNMMDLAAMVDMMNTMIRLDISGFVQEEVEDLESQLDIIKYRSYQTINDTYGGKV